MNLAATIISIFVGILYLGVFIFAVFNDWVEMNLLQYPIWLFVPIVLATLSFLNGIERIGIKKEKKC